jgi:hypothetical protein
MKIHFVARGGANITDRAAYRGRHATKPGAGNAAFGASQ